MKRYIALQKHLQRVRIGLQNRLGRDGLYKEELLELCESIIGLEDRLDKEIEQTAKEHPIYHELLKIKGIGPKLASRLVAYIDIRKCNTVSQLWRYAGYGVVDGKAERAKKGETRHYCGELKTILYLVALAFLRSHSPYTHLYYEEREKHPDLKPMHQHLRGLRKMIKMFLSHLWEKWRTLEGLETRKAYVIEVLGHTHIHEAKDYGWE